MDNIPIRLHTNNGNIFWLKECSKFILHREDGPALIYADGEKHWYYHGEKIDCQDQETFERILKLKVFW